MVGVTQALGMEKAARQEPLEQGLEELRRVGAATQVAAAVAEAGHAGVVC